MSNPIIPKDTFQRILINIKRELDNESIELQEDEVTRIGKSLTATLTKLGIDIEEQGHSATQEANNAHYKGYDIIPQGDNSYIIMIDDVCIDDASSLELAKEAIDSRLA